VTKSRLSTYIIREERKNTSDINLLVDFKKEANLYMSQYIFRKYQEGGEKNVGRKARDN
jgi:predicted nucleotidyltransferase